MPVKLEPKAFRVLAYLIQYHDCAVTKRDLFEPLWPGEFVTESALIRCIVKARQAVQDDGASQRVIKTVHGHGYRFIVAIETRAHDPTTSIPPAAHTSAHKVVDAPSNASKPLADNFPTGLRAPEGERKQVTILAAGVQGLTALALALDPEALHEVVNRLFELLHAEVQRVEGVAS